MKSHGKLNKYYGKYNIKLEWWKSTSTFKKFLKFVCPVCIWIIEKIQDVMFAEQRMKVRKIVETWAKSHSSGVSISQDVFGFIQPQYECP